jgi:hypothetical protein
MMGRKPMSRLRDAGPNEPEVRVAERLNTVKQPEHPPRFTIVIRAPLSDIPVHIVKTELVRQLLAHRMMTSPSVPAPPHVVIRRGAGITVIGVTTVTKRKGRLRAATRGVLPLRLRR